MLRSRYEATNGRCESVEGAITRYGEPLLAPLTHGRDFRFFGNREAVGRGLSQWWCLSCAGGELAPTGPTANSTSTGPALANMSIALNGLPCWMGSFRFSIIR